MTRLHRDFLGGSLSSAVSASGTGSDVLHSAAFVSVGLVTAPDVLAVSLNPDGLRGLAPEIVHVTSHALGANTLLATRGQEGTTARAWPSGTPWVHAFTALDADSAASGGGGGGGEGVEFAFGPPSTPVVTVSGDATTAGSWYGPAAVRFYTWTPTRTGLVVLPAPPADADTQERDFMVWSGTVENVSYPGRTDASGSFGGSPAAHSYTNSGGSGVDSFSAVAGTSYTVAVLYWGASAYTGRSIGVADLWRRLQQFGGVTPLVPPDATTAVGVATDGDLVMLDPPYDPSDGNTITGTGGAWAIGTGTTASGQSSVAEGNTSVASGAKSHAEGDHTQATGLVSHAEGSYSLATGFASHAEGNGSDAAGQGAHAEGQGTGANGDASHAEGMGAHADRPADHAQGGGSVTVGGSGRDVQATRLVLSASTLNATPGLLVDAAGGAPALPSYAAAVTGLVLAAKNRPFVDAVGLAEMASWRIDALVLTDSFGGARLVGQTVTALFHSSGAAAWTVAFDVDAGTLAYKVTVTGAAATNIGWVCYLDAAELR